MKDLLHILTAAEERLDPNELSSGMDVDWEKVKEFIREELTNLYTELQKEREAERELLVEKVEKLKRSEANREDEYYENVAFNDGIRSVLALIKNNCMEKESKSEYRLIDGNKPRWVTFDVNTGQVWAVDSYRHQDENYSNLCAFDWCKCQA